MVRIIVADEHAIYRRGLRAILQAALPDAEFLEAADLDGLLQLLMGLQSIDLALVSLNLTGEVDPQIIWDLKRAAPTTHYVALAAEYTFDQVLRFVAEGFQGFVSKQQREDEIVRSIRDVLDGRLAVPRDLTPFGGAHAEGRPSREPPRRRSPQQNLFSLTRRQRDVLELLADGLSNREIAQALHIAEPTTKIHVSALMRVLHVRNRTEAAVMARDLLGGFEDDPQDGNN